METSMNLAEIASCLTALIATIALWKNIRDKRFDEIRNEMREGFAKTDQKFEKIDEKFEKIDERFNKMDEKMGAGFDKINERFKKVDDKIEQGFNKNDIQLNEIRNDLHQMNVRLSVLEAETILYQAIPDLNARSESAKKMWKRRKMKALESHQK